MALSFQTHLKHYTSKVIPADQTTTPTLQGLQLLYKVVQGLAGTNEIETGLNQVLKLIATDLHWDVAVAWLKKAGTRTEVICAWHSPAFNAQRLVTHFRQRDGKEKDTLAGHVIKSQSLIFVPDIELVLAGDERYIARKSGLRSALGIPLSGRNHVVGVIELLSHSPNEPSPELMSLLYTLGKDVGQFLEACILNNALHDQKQKFLQTQRIARLAPWELDLATSRLFGSRDTAVVMGLPVNFLPENLHDLFALIPEEDHDIFKGVLAGAQRMAYPFVTAEHRLQFGNETRYLMVRAEGQFDNNGKAVRISGTMQDITEQKLASIQIAVSQQHWEVAFRNSPVASIITEIETGLCLDANEEMCRLLHLPREDIIGCTTAQLSIWPAGNPRESLVEEVKKNGSVRQKEFYVHIDGVKHVLLINIERIEFNQCDALFGQWVDITPVKRLEEKLRLTAAAVEHAADALVLLDQQGHIVALNPAFTAITGYNTDQALDQWFLALLHKPTGKHNKEFFKNVIHTLEEKGQWKGEVWAQRANGEIFPSSLTLGVIRTPDMDETNANEMNTNDIRHYVGVFSDISRQKEYEERLKLLALHDELTGLVNRTLLIERGNRALLQAERQGGMVGVLFVDLDRFKLVNDRYGHLAGDSLLQQVAERLCLCVRASDTVARVGGDEFVILLTDLSHVDDAHRVADKVGQALLQPLSIERANINIGASVGVACYPDDGVDMTMLLKCADDELYQVKRASKPTPEF